MGRSRNGYWPRKIYREHYGEIPIDDVGRSYEIHHIDGDHTNNDPKNLEAISIQDHYNKHYEQGDYGACYYIAIHKLYKSKEEISELSRKAHLGKKHSEEAKEKMRQAALGRKNSPEAIEKMRASKKGKKFSEAAKLGMRNGGTGKYKRSEEHKAKLRIILDKGRETRWGGR